MTNHQNCAQRVKPGFSLRTTLILLLAGFLVVLVTLAFSYARERAYTAHAVTTVPTKMNFQGRLTDSTGNVKANGTYNMRLKLYTVSSGGSNVWSEDRLVSATQGVTVTNGLFSIQLGDITSLPASLFASGDLYLEVELPTPATATSSTPTWTEGPMTPRNQLATSAYAYNAETLDGQDGDYYLNAGNLTGTVAGARLSGSYTGITGTGTLSVGSIASGFGTISTGNTITGTTLNGTTGINTGAGAGTQRIDASGNLLNIGSITATGNVVISGDLLQGSHAANGLGDSGSMVPNSGFEINNDGTSTVADSWTGVIDTAGSTFTTTTTAPAEGTRSQQITSTSTSAAHIDSLCFPIAGGNRYNLSAFMKADAAATDGFYLRLATYTTKANCSATTSATNYDAVTDGSMTTNYTQYSATFTPAATQLWAQVQVYNSLPNATRTMTFDSVRLSRVVPEYIHSGTNPQSANFNITGNGVIGGTLTVTGDTSFNGSVVLAANQSLRITGGTTANRPSSPSEGMVFYDTTTKQLLTYANGKWQADRTDAVLVAASNSSQADRDVADYVADGNTGAANDGDQVQINAALTAGSGKKVVLLAGTYVADATILVPNSTTLAGVGNGTVVELADLDATDNLIENSDTTTGTGVVIQDLKLDGRNDLNNAGTQAGISFTGMGGGSGSTARQGASVKNLQITRFETYGMHFTSSNNNVVSSVSLKLIDSRGIFLDTSSYNTFSNSSFQSAGIAISVVSSSFNTITSNNFTDNGRGISFYSSLSNNVNSNNFSSNSHGVYVDLSNKNVISENSFVDSGGSTSNDAVFLAASDSNIISSNIITDSSATTTNYAIDISNAASDTNYVADNTLGGGAINNAGTGTIYGGQLNSSNNYLIQPAGTIELMKNTNVTGSIVSNNTISGTQLTSTVATGTAPLVVTSTTKVTNLNVDQLDGLDSTAFAAASGSANYIQNTTVAQTADFNVTGNGRVGGTMTVAGNDIFFGAGDAQISGQGALYLGNYATTQAFSVLNNGSFTVFGSTAGRELMWVDTTANTIDIDGSLAVTGTGLFQNTTNSTNAFSINNQAAGSLFKVDTTNAGEVTILGNNSGANGSWSTNANVLPVQQYEPGSVVANGYVYVVGGYGSMATYYAKLNADGTTGTWSTAANNLPDDRYAHSVVTANGYLYVFGGNDTTTQYTNVWYTKLNADGSIGAWQVSANVLPQARDDAAAVVSGGYVYVMGGYGAASYQSTVWYAKLNADGSVGTWTVNANALPTVNNAPTAVVANGYVYVLGGVDGTSVKNTVYSAQINANGSLGTWASSANTMPGQRQNHTSVVSNGYVYVMGGTDNASAVQGNVWYSKLGAGGTLGTWSTSTNSLPGVRAGASSVVANGYAYVINGSNGATQNTVYYSRLGGTLKVGGNLDLVGLQGQNLADGGDGSVGSTGGSITAGNITAVGSLTVAKQALFSDSASVTGNFNAGNGIFSVDTASSTILIGSSIADSTGVVLVLDTKNTSGDPTGSNGAMYYNSNAGKFRCYENGVWKDCDTGMSLLVQTTNNAAPVDAETNYFGGHPLATTTNAGNRKIFMPVGGIIKKARVTTLCTTAGTSESWTMYVRVNNTTDYTIATVGAATNERNFLNNSMNTNGITVAAGDYIEIKSVQPTWATNPANCTMVGYVILE